MAFLITWISRLLAAVVLISGSLHAADTTAPAVTLELSLDREKAIYACGEQARITITAVRGDIPVMDGEVAVRLIGDFRTELGTITVPLKGGQAVLTYTLDDPGFLTCQAQLGKAEEMTKPWVFSLPNPKVTLAFSPERIAPSLAEPEDFDAFWEASRKEVAAIPLDPIVTPLPQWSQPTFDAYRISLANLDGTRAWAFLSVPKQGEGPFPLLVTVPGANLRAPSKPEARLTEKGVMRLLISVHAHDPNMPKDELDQLIKDKIGGYTRMGAPDRDQYYYRRAILGADRLIDYVCDNYQWDGTHCVVSGGSQGGAFALFMAGLNSKVTACAADKPALCDHGGYTVGRGTGWPNLASYQEPELQAATLAMSGYFDAVFFAKRISVPSVLGVGFLDATCPPSSVYAAYNQIEPSKRIFNQPQRGHQFGKSDYDQFVDTQWIPGMLGLREQLEPTKDH